MTCCIVAMLIIAHVMATLRRWGVFWGIVRPTESEEIDTVYRRIRIWSARPHVRIALIALVAVEGVASASWLTLAHGRHIYQLGDQVIGRINGQTIVYSDVCDGHGRSRTLRVAITQRDEFGRRTISETML